MNADRPARRLEDDLLERGHLVELVAQWVRQAPLDEGFVIGLTGSWGSGKTTILHFLEEVLEPDATVVWFEPWLFSNADQLVTRFFDELATRLTGEGVKRHMRKVGKQLANYGTALSPAASLLMGPAGGLLATPNQVANIGANSASAQRRAIRSSLRRHAQRIVVLIDDLDRLNPHEVGEVLRLVKLVADLPGVVHILSYDRRRVERSLNTLGSDDGNAYLQKIVQASICVPPTGHAYLLNMSMDWLTTSLNDCQLQMWDRSVWSELVRDGIGGYLKTIRDGRRFANMAPTAIRLCGDEVASMDVLALEAMRIFDPTIHEALPSLADILVRHQQQFFEFRKPKEVDDEQRCKLEAILSESAAREPTTHILRVLFPAAGHLLGGTRAGVDPSWRKQKRVASRSVLLRYLHHTLEPSDAAARTVDAALRGLANASDFAKVLASVEDARLADLIDRIRERLGEQTDIDVLGCSLVLLNQRDRLVRRPRGFELDPTRRATWLINQLIASLPADERPQVVQRLIEAAPTLTLQAQSPVPLSEAI